MKKVCLLIIYFFCLLQAEAQFTQRGWTLEYHGRQKKSIYTSPVSISFQGCSSTTNDKSGNLSLVFPNAKAGNVVSCTDLEISNSEYVIFNRNDFDIWTLGDRRLPIVLCKKSKIDNYVAIYTKVQMEAANAKYKKAKKELYKSEKDNSELRKELKALERRHEEEIKEIKANALIFAYIDEEKMDSLQYEQHLCILNNDIKRAVEIGREIDFKNNMSKQLSNFEKSVKKSQEIGLKLFQETEALYLHIANCELLSIDKDSLRDDYDILIRSYRSLLSQYPINFKCNEDTYKKTRIKFGNILYKYAKNYLEFSNKAFITGGDVIYKTDSLTFCYMKEAYLYQNSDAILWLVQYGENYKERKLFAKELLNGIKNGELSIPKECDYYTIKDICECFPDFQIEDDDKILYYSIISDSSISVSHFYCKNPKLRQIKIPQSVQYQRKKYAVTQIGFAAFGGTSTERWLKGDLLRDRIPGDDWPTHNYPDYTDTTIDANTDSEQDIVFNIHLPKTIEYVGAGAFCTFHDCVKIKINGIPKRLKILRSNSFIGCNFARNKIEIPDNVEIVECDALPTWDTTYLVSLPKSLKKLDLLNGYSGGNCNNSVGKIIDINNNPHFRVIDGALYTADSSYVYLGTVGQYNNILHITRNMEIDEDFINRLHYTRLWIDSICFDDRNPYYAYYKHCIYTKQLDTLLYVLPSAENVWLSDRLKDIEVMDMPSSFYHIPADMPISGMKTCLDIFLFYHKKFELFGKVYDLSDSESDNEISKMDFIDLLLKDNKNNPKLLGVKALLFLEDEKFYNASELLDSIEHTNQQNTDYSILLDSCCSYSKRINTYMEEYKSINSNDHNKMVEICLKLRDYFDNTADYLNNEVDVYNAFYNNWVLGVQKSYDNIYYSFLFMEKGIPYALKLVNEFDKEKYKNIVSDFYVSLSNVALGNDDKSSKAFQYANKSLVLNPNNIEAYEALGSYFYHNGGVEKNKKIQELILRVEKIDSNYRNSKDNFLYQLLDNGTKSNSYSY